MQNKVNIIAFYLPQYHPTPDNDMWWGKGFTEWTNVGKAKPLFWGHYQPKVPADLGYYDLRLPEIREAQAELAKEAGIDGFCYYHYWFGNGKQELELPFDEVIKSGKPDFPFCLCWANESWSKKFWNKDGSVAQTHTRLLIEQKYLGATDDEAHFNSLLPAFKDSRYMKIDNKPIFVIYRPLMFPNISEFIQHWNSLAQQNGFDGMYFIGYSTNADVDGSTIFNYGFESVISCRLNSKISKGLKRYWRKLISLFFHTPRRDAYKDLIPRFVTDLERHNDKYIPTLIPNWDHTPRSGVNGYVLTGSTPELFYKHCIDVLSSVVCKDSKEKLCFIKSWNEWGEGNYMEPDLKFGKGYIEALRKALKCIKIK